MSYSNGIVTPPVSIHDVQQALSVGYNDIGRLCRAGAINKWAKYKPVHCAKVGRLTEQDFEDQVIDTTTTTHYGLYIGEIHFDASLHDADYNYIGYPRGGASSPYRLTDFVDGTSTGGTANAKGYKHDAVPSLTGTPSFDTSTTTHYPIVLANLRYNPVDGCVDVQDFMSTGSEITNCHPCVMVTYNRQTTKWTVMYEGTPGDPNPHVAQVSTTSQNFYIDLPTWHTSSGFSDMGDYKISFFLYYFNSSIGEGVTNYKGVWTDVSGPAIMTATPIPVPDCMGLNLTLQSPYAIMEFDTLAQHGIVTGTHSFLYFYCTPIGTVTDSSGYKVALNIDGQDIGLFAVTPQESLVATLYHVDAQLGVIYDVGTTHTVSGNFYFNYNGTNMPAGSFSNISMNVTPST